MSARHKKGDPPKDRTLDDMQRFYRSLDLAELWQEFYVSIGPSGRPKYRSSRQFARNLGKNEKQIEFLTWLFGEKGADPAADKEYRFAEPLEFDRKRDTGGWYTHDSLKAHVKDITKEINALEALRAAGNGVTVYSLERWETLARQLDEDFGGRFFVDGLSMRDNIIRARAYIGLHKKILDGISEAQDIYAKSHGINFQDMSGFERLLAAQAMTLAASNQNASNNSAVEKLLRGLVAMTVEKGVKHGFELPADVNKVVTMSVKKANVM